MAEMMNHGAGAAARSGSTRAAAFNSSENEELEDTRNLVRVCHLVLEHYRVTITRKTGADGATKKAADRVEEALVECMRRATDELAGNCTRTESPTVFQCSFCGGEHQLLRDVAVLNDADRFDHLPLMQTDGFRYSYLHAREVIRQLQVRGLLPAPAERAEQVPNPKLQVPNWVPVLSL